MRKRSKNSASALKSMIKDRKDIKSKIKSLEKEHRMEKVSKNVPYPKRDLQTLAHIQNKLTDSEKDDTEMFTDDYYTIEADISSMGGYINIMRWLPVTSANYAQY